MTLKTDNKKEELQNCAASLWYVLLDHYFISSHDSAVKAMDCHTIKSGRFPQTTIWLNCSNAHKKSHLTGGIKERSNNKVKKRKGKGAYSSSWNSPQNYGTPLVNGITQCYLPPDRGDRPAFTQTGQVGTRFIDPVRMKGWVGWLHSEMVYPSTDGHPSEY